MAGHSKWANIKHRKARQDRKRGRQFAKLIREVTMAAKLGTAKLDDNPRLRTAVGKAMAENIPKSTIERAIGRGCGEDGECALDELTYEGYAPGGVAVLVEAVSDNRNRTVAEVRHTFNKYGGSLGTDGSVSYLFSRKGQITYAPGADEETVLALALEAGAEDVETCEDGSLEVITGADDLLRVQGVLQDGGQEPLQAEIALLPRAQVVLDAAAAIQVLRLAEALEDLDDVQYVFTNAEFPDEAYAD